MRSICFFNVFEKQEKNTRLWEQSAGVWRIGEEHIRKTGYYRVEEIYVESSKNSVITRSLKSS